MLKFKTNSKELKGVTEKAMTAINKKAPFAPLTKIYYKIGDNGVLTVLGTDREQYVEVRTDNVTETSPGEIGIDIEDVKAMSKMNGEIIVEDVGDSHINLTCGKKTVTIPNYNDGIGLPKIDEPYEHVLTFDEDWLLDTIQKLSTFTVHDDRQKMAYAFHFNTVEKRVEALDGYRLAYRDFSWDNVAKESNVLLHNMCLPVLKKVLKGKYDDDCKIYQNSKYVRIEGEDFTYVQRRMQGKYFNVSRLLLKQTDYSFTCDRDNVLEIMKYDCDIIGKEKIPVIFYADNERLYTYLNSSRYQIFDVLDVKKAYIKDGTYFAVNPRYIMEAFSTFDTCDVVVKCSSPKHPVTIDCGDFHHMLMTVSFNLEDEMEKEIKKRIEKDRVA